MSKHKIQRSHYTNFGVTMQPVEADAEGYLHIRDDFEEAIPEAEWSPAEIWVADMESQIARWRAAERRW